MESSYFFCVMVNPSPLELVIPLKPLAQAMPVLLVSPAPMDYVKLKH
jgi:hypothetical protein